MLLVSALELVLNRYDIYEVDSLVAILRSPHDCRQVADLIESSRALIDATAGAAEVSTQTEATLTQAEAPAAAADRRQLEAALAHQPVKLSVQILPHLHRARCMNARTQTPALMKTQVSVASQVPSSEVAAAAAKQQRHDKQLQALSARQKARDELVPVLERAITAAEEAERRASEKQADVRRSWDCMRLMAERRAREAAAATADRRAAAEERAAAAHLTASIERRYAVKLAVLCKCMSELEQENIGLEDTVWGLWEMLQTAKEGQYRCLFCSQA